MDLRAFYAGSCFDAYHWLGAHFEGAGVTFRTFAPAAKKVALIGEFSDWQELPMAQVKDGNFWQCTVAEARQGQMYKYRIYDQAGHFCDHCDPYGFYMELRPGNASRLWNIENHAYTDGAWMGTRTDCRDKPLNIYEMHFGSWKKKNDEPDGWYNYEELADLLIPYLSENGYNYLEIMPLAEHPCDESWGYQCTGFFSPTSRYGTPEQLMSFVNRCHIAGIGVLLDFVPVHFAVDGYALANYDGTPLYEYPHRDVGRSEWGSCNFMHSRGEVCSFLQSNARMWMDEYHFDGLRMDAISNMIYWQGDPARGVNANATSFLREMNRGLKAMFPTAILAAEDSTNFAGVTSPVDDGGLGFDYKWNMGWMNDTLQFFQTGPEYRSRDYHKLTFSMQYFYDARYLLPLSHDEVVHGKATIVQKMHGDYKTKFPQARALYLYMMAHPGKKLNFMGNELAQLREWDEKRGQDWMLLGYPVHERFQGYIRALNRVYLEHPALWQADYGPDGFAWVDCQQEEKCLYLFQRSTLGQSILAVLNLSDEKQSCDVTLPETAWMELLISTEDARFGGSEKRPVKKVVCKEGTARLTLPAFSGRLFLLHG